MPATSPPSRTTCGCHGRTASRTDATTRTRHTATTGLAEIDPNGVAKQSRHVHCVVPTNGASFARAMGRDSVESLFSVASRSTAIIIQYSTTSQGDWQIGWFTLAACRFGIVWFFAAGRITIDLAARSHIDSHGVAVFGDPFTSPDIINTATIRRRGDYCF